VALARRARALTKQEIEAITGLARLYCSEGDYDRAVWLYREAMEKTDNAPFVRIGLAAVLFEKGDFNKAEKHYRILLEKGGDSPVVIYNLGQTLCRQNRVKEAREYFLRFIELYENVLPGLAEKARGALEKHNVSG